MMDVLFISMLAHLVIAYSQQFVMCCKQKANLQYLYCHG
nr:hypothetical protein Iba_chr14fCG6380 [Ipomoea batatas]